MDDLSVHFEHCYQGENENHCKYGDKDCPATPNTKLDKFLEEWTETDEDNRPTAKQELNNYFYQEFVDLVGEDDEIYGVGTGSDEKRGANQLRTELIAQAKIRFGIK